MTTRFFRATFEDVDHLLDNTSSVTDVECWVVERFMYAKTPKAENENLTKDPHVNISSNTSLQNYVNPVNYESTNAGLELTQEAVDTEIIEESDSNSDSEEGIQILDLGEYEIIDELDFRELEQIPHLMVKLMEEQVLEEFMLEEETDFQDIDKCKMVERGIDRKLVNPPEISVRMACEQEECIEEEIFIRSLPELQELCKAQESIHKDDIQLENAQGKYNRNK